MTRGSQSPRREAAERHAEWLALFTSGASYAQIANRHGVTKSTVHEAIHKQLAAARDRRDGLADTALELQLARYEWLWAKTVASVATAGAGREVGRAQLLATGRSILDSMNKLMGFDQGVTVNVRSESLLDQEIAALTARMSLIIDGETVDDPAAELPSATGDDDR